MKTILGTLGLACLSLALTACGDTGNDPQPAPTGSLPAQTAGARQVTLSGETLSTGITLVNAKGQGFILLSEDGDSATSAVQIITGSGYVHRVPASADFQILGTSASQNISLLELKSADLLGNYQAVISGKSASFSVAADGSISANGSLCSVTGKVDLDSNYGNGHALTLQLSQCGSSNGSYQGVLFASSDSAPAAWQAVLENGSTVLARIFHGSR